MAVQMSQSLLGRQDLTKKDAIEECDAYGEDFNNALTDKGDKLRVVASKMLRSDCVTIGSWDQENPSWPQGPVVRNTDDDKVKEYQQIFALPDDNAVNIKSLLFTQETKTYCILTGVLLIF